MAGRFSIEAVFKTVDRVTAPVTRMQNRVQKFTRSMARGFNRANRALRKVVTGLKNGARAAAKFAIIGIGAVTASIGLLIREFSKIENAEAAFTPLLGGVERAKKLVDELNKTAATTPFQFETLAGAASQLLPVMNGDIKNTVKTIRLLGDTAGGNAQKLESITRGFTKAMLKGKVDMEALNMIAEAGVPIFTELSSSMGVTNKTFFKMVTAGKVTTAQLTKAFEKMTSEGGIFFKGMEIASRTTTGLFSTLKDNISLTAAELGSVLAPTIKEIIKGLTDVAKKARVWVKANRELINEKFLKFVETVKNFIRGLGTAFEFLAEHGATILKVIAGVVALSLALKAMTIVLAVVNLLMFANPVGLLVVALVGAAALIMAAWDPLSAFFTDLWDGIVLSVSDAFGKIFGMVDKIIETIREAGVAVSDFFSFGDDDEDEAGGAGSRRGFPERFGVTGPAERVARNVEEHRATSSAELTIRDETGRAEITGGKMGGGLVLQQTGEF